MTPETIYHGIPIANPSAPPLPNDDLTTTYGESLEAALAQCARCNRLDWRENMQMDSSGQFFCSDLACQLPPRRQCCCTIS